MPLALFLTFTALIVPAPAFKMLAVCSAYLWWMGTYK